MGLLRRRHFAVEGRAISASRTSCSARAISASATTRGSPSDDAPGAGLRGYSTLLAALERGRTGTLGDIVATIQAEQDEIIRSPQAGVLVVQGGPGTGKTVVALHRAAYLLYTHRFPLEDQGCSSSGRTGVPALHRAGAAVARRGGRRAGRARRPRAQRALRLRRRARRVGDTRRIKGDARMSALIDRAIGDRERPLRRTLVVPFRRLPAPDRRRVGAHRQGAPRRFRRTTPAAVTSRASSSPPSPRRRATARFRPASCARSCAASGVRAALERMWPVLTPGQLLHDLFGSRALLRLAARNLFDDAEIDALYRPRVRDVADVRWTASDIALLDDAREVLGPVPTRNGRIDEADEIRTYGHIVVDEVQDLSPMQLKMVARRSLNGSLTVVGDLAQATGPWAPSSWATSPTTSPIAGPAG